jgi:subtilisin family serine protease
MTGLSRRMTSLAYRLCAYVIVATLLLSSFVHIPPVQAATLGQIDVDDKIDENLWNKTFSDDQMDLLISYDNQANEFKVRNSIDMLDKTAQIVKSYRDLNMLRVKMMGNAIIDLAQEVFVTKIWSNEVQEIQPMETPLGTSIPAEDYVSLIDRIGARDLWDQGYNGTGVVIAVLDTGVDLFHPDLTVSSFASFVEADTLPTDIIGHGTYAASVAAGTGNASDGTYAGIAPGATIISAKVTLGGLFAAPSWIASGVEWASSRGADIILLPFNTLGAPGDVASEAIRAATEKGIFVVTASGDDGPDYLTVMSPGGSAEAFCVGAYDTANQEIPDFSGRGPSLQLLTKPDLVAPGVGVIGAKMGSGFEDLGLGSIGLDDLGDLGGLGGLLGGSLGESVDDDYIIADTTTASAAITAGAAAILLQAFDRASPIALGNTLRDTATPIGYGANDGGAGLLNLPAAFQYLSQKQSPGEAHNRTTGTPLIALGILSTSGYDASTTMLMSSYGTSIAALDSRNPQDSGFHLMMGMLSLKWNNMDPTNLMMFDVKRELHQVVMGAGTYSYDRHVGVLAYDDEIFVTLVVEAYNLTEYSTLPLTGFRITPYVLNLGSSPIENVSFYASYTLDLYGDGIDDHGKYDLDNEQLFAYGISEDYGNFYMGINSSIPLDGFEVGNSSEVSGHVSDDALTGATTFDGSVGLGMKWNLGTVDVNSPANVTLALGFGENRTVLDASIDAMWSLDVPTETQNRGDLLVVEVDIPRIAETGEIYQSSALVMNIGYNVSPIVAAFVVGDGLTEDGSLYTQYTSLDSVEPFQAAVVTADWIPEGEGVRFSGWAAITGIDQLLSLLTQISLTSALSILDDFIIRDIFSIEPISSTSIFPKDLPFAPFDIRFPADFGIYTFVLSSTEPLGNITAAKYGNATDWGNITLPSEENVEGFYNFSLFLLAPPITVDGYHRCDYEIMSETGWSMNVTLERVLEYPRAMMLLETSHGGGFGSLLGGGLGGDLGGGGFDMGGGGLSFPLAQESEEESDDDGGFSMDFSLTDLDSLDSLTGLFDAFRMTTFSGLSNMKKQMADVGLDLVETPGMELNPDLLATFAAVFIIAPTEEYNITEIEILRDFTSGGGRLVILGDTDEISNHTILNGLVNPYGYSFLGDHDRENTTAIVTTSILGAGMDCMWLGGGSYIMGNQSLASVRVDGNSVVLLDATSPELVLFGSSKIFMNKNLPRCNNSILLDNLNQFLLTNTITTRTSLSEPTDQYPVGKSVYLNIELEDFYGNPVDDLFVAIIYILPNGSQAFFYAAFVEDGLYSSQFTPSYWKSAGEINGVFIVLGDENYAMTYASVTFYLYDVPVPTTPPPVIFGLTMPQVALITSVGVFGGMIVGLVYNRRRMKKRLRIPEVDPDLVMEIDSTLNMLLAAFTQLEELIKREDLDRIQKVEALRVLMENIEEARRMFDRVSEKVGGV